MQGVQNDFVNGFKDLGVSFTAILPNIPKALVAFIIGFLIVKILARFIRGALRWTRWPEGLQEILNTLIRVALWIFLAITVLQILGLTNVALAISGSFAILLIGFSTGISNTVSDLMAGLQIANDKDFKVGYKVIAGDRKTEGIVREMDVKKIRIVDSEGRMHVIPNSLVEKNEWVVLERHVHSKMPRPSAILKEKVKRKVSKS